MATRSWSTTARMAPGGIRDGACRRNCESESMAPPIVTLENVSKTYRMGEMKVPVLKGISLTVDAGEFVAVMGQSGSGKSTLMNILGCLDTPTSDRYVLDGRDVTG